MRNVVIIILTIFALWGGGFAYYLYTINSYEPSNNTTSAIVVFVGGGRRVETAIALLKAGYAPILFITGVESTNQLQNLLKEQNVREQQVIYAHNKTMTEEDYAKKTADFVLTHNITSIRLVTSNYNMPVALKKINEALPSAQHTYVIPHPVFSAGSKQYSLLFRSYNDYLMRFF
jgi:uncharacterized SAM-binding protein YcdF (DUF218 family)